MTSPSRRPPHLIAHGFKDLVVENANLGALTVGSGETFTMSRGVVTGPVEFGADLGEFPSPPRAVDYIAIGYRLPSAATWRMGTLIIRVGTGAQSISGDFFDKRQYGRKARRRHERRSNTVRLIGIGPQRRNKKRP